MDTPASNPSAYVQCEIDLAQASSGRLHPEPARLAPERAVHRVGHLPVLQTKPRLYAPGNSYNDGQFDAYSDGQF